MHEMRVTLVGLAVSGFEGRGGGSAYHSLIERETLFYFVISAYYYNIVGFTRNFVCSRKAVFFPLLFTDSKESVSMKKKSSSISGNVVY